MELSSVPSSSSNTSQFKHDVFLSFRGEDTRYNFTSHLHTALDDKGIKTFIDYGLKRGDEISPSLLQSIEESQISIIIFSKNYASSRWCLEELVKILECKNREMDKQIVIPVFYWVTPSEVRNKTGSLADALAYHEKRFKDDLDKTQKWKDALTEAANLSGWTCSTDKPDESLLIKDIVQDCLMRLIDLSSSDTSNLVGIDSKVKEIKSWLCTSVRTLGIWGIGGIGKTTLAEAVFNSLSHQFEGSYFIYNVKEQCDQSNGLYRMQKELLSAILGDRNVNKGTLIVGCTFIKNTLGRKKLLIVLDDVSDFRQLEILIGGVDCLSLHSRIIITTRDKQVLRNCGVDQVFEVQELNHCEALKLFCKHAFRGNHPKVDYVHLLNEVTRYAGGVPLALKILGSYLFDKGKEFYKSAMNKLERIPLMGIQKVLKISYDGLDDDEVQKIFLDIAIFFNMRGIGVVESFLNACGLHAKVGIRVLVDKALIAISNDIITIHDLLQAMAKEIVRQESITDPSKRSRLWNHEDICRVLTKNTGTEKIEGISLDMSKIEDIFLSSYTFSNMHELRFLEFKVSSWMDGNKVHVSQSLECDFSELRYLHWYACPLKSLPSSNHLENLVTLNMRWSKVKQLWSGVMHLDKLKEIDLSYSSLTICPDLSGSPNLQILNLNGCKNLKMLSEMPCNIQELWLESTSVEELPSSSKNLSKLHRLNLADCMRLKRLPSSICKWKSLISLSLNGCCKHEQLPDDIGTLDSLKYLYARGVAIKELPSSISTLKNIEILQLCTSTEVHGKVNLFLPDHIADWQNLTVLSLRDSGIIKLFDNLGCLCSLKSLDLAKNSFESIPESIINLFRLESLDISYCERLECLPKLPSPFFDLCAHNCTSLKVLAGVSSQNGVVSMDSKWRKKTFRADFSNCLKLDVKVVEGFWQNVTQEREMEMEEFNDDWVCYRGSQAPSGFDMHMGSSMKVELSLNLIYSSLLLCVVMAPIPGHPDYFCSYPHICWKCSLKLKDKYLHVFGNSFLFCSRICFSNHTFLSRFHNDQFRGFLRECHQRSPSPSEVIEASFEFSIANTRDHEIVQCGVHFISAHTTESFHESFIENETQQIEVYHNSLEEDEPHPKRLKIFDIFSEHPTNQVHDNCKEEDEAPN